MAGHGQREPLHHPAVRRPSRTTSSASWAERPEPRPQPRAQAPYAAARRARISAMHPGERLIIPAGPAKVALQRHRLPVPRALGLLLPHRLGQRRRARHRPRARADRRRPRRDAVLPADRRAATPTSSTPTPRSASSGPGPRPSLAHVAADLGLDDPAPRRLRRVLEATDGTTRIVREADRDLTDQLDGRRLLAAELGADAATASTRTATPSSLRDLSELRLVKDDYEIGEMRARGRRHQAGLRRRHRRPAADRRAPARRAPRRGHLQPPRPRRGQHGRLRHDRRERPARLHPALDPQRRPRRAGRPHPDRRGHRARQPLHRRHHAHPARSRAPSPTCSAGSTRRCCEAADAARRDRASPASGSARSTPPRWQVIAAQDRRVGPPAGQRRGVARPRPRSTTAATWCTAPATTSASTCTTARRPAASCTSTARCSRGMVFTIEPGLYFQPDDLTVPEEYRGIGVRIEDDILVTADGCENLSAGIPRTADDVEAWLRRLTRRPSRPRLSRCWAGPGSPCALARRAPGRRGSGSC